MLRTRLGMNSKCSCLNGKWRTASQGKPQPWPLAAQRF